MGKAKRAANIALNVLMYIFLAVCLFSVFVTVLSKQSRDGVAEVFGYQMRIVTSDSMSESEFTDVSAYEIKDIPIRSMVFVKVIPEDPEDADEFYRGLKVGDVITFRYAYTTQVTITHRITSITENETGGFTIELAGDNKTSPDGQLIQKIDTSAPNSTNYVIGKVTGQSYLIGLIMSFFMQPIGIIFAVIVPCLVIILLEILKIANVLGADKKKRAQDEKESRENEIEALRRRVAELEEQKNGQSTANAISKEEDAK